jgi:phosphohistidine phosphatase SixA
MVGHNPTMEETVSTLLAGPTEDEAVAIRIPTAGLVCLEVGIADWAMLQPGQASLRWFLIPKLVKAITG